MIWQDRTRTDPTKRKFIDENGVEQNVNIEEIQSNITQSGTPVNATTMNNIEKNLGTYGNDSYDSTATYSIGDVVTHNALLYRAKQDIETPEEWTEAHWEETSALDELKKTSGNEVLISDDEGDITYQTKIFVDSDTGTAKYRDTNDSFVPLKDNEVIISDTEPTSNDNEIWVEPNGTLPYVNSEVNIGATNVSNTPVWFKQGKNLVNFNDFIEGLYSINNGAYIYGQNNTCNPDFIEIDNTKNYVLSIGNNTNDFFYVLFYDSNKTYLGNISGKTSVQKLVLNTFSNYSNVKYINIRIDINKSNITNLMLEKGNTNTTYEEYITPTIIIDDEKNYQKMKVVKGTINVTTDGIGRFLLYIPDSAISVQAYCTNTTYFLFERYISVSGQRMFYTKKLDDFSASLNNTNVDIIYSYIIPE